MKKRFVGFIVFFMCLSLFACEQAPEEYVVDDEEATYDIFDFYFINQAPAATEKHLLGELVKIYFSTKAVAIDVGNNEFYEIPRFATNGVAIFEDPLPFDDKEGLLVILDKYNVQTIIQR